MAADGQSVTISVAELNQLKAQLKEADANGAFWKGGHAISKPLYAISKRAEPPAFDDSIKDAKAVHDLLHAMLAVLHGPTGPSAVGVCGLYFLGR